MLDIPQYKSHPLPERLLVRKVITLVFLGMLLYLGLWVNFFLLHEPIPSFLNTIMILLIVIVLMMESLLCYVKYANYTYTFFRDRLEIQEGKKTIIPYTDIRLISYKQNYFDKRFRTGTIILSTNRRFKLDALQDSTQIYFFLQKMLQK